MAVGGLNGACQPQTFVTPEATIGTLTVAELLVKVIRSFHETTGRFNTPGFFPCGPGGQPAERQSAGQDQAL